VRYLDVPIVSFTGTDGRSVAVHEMREVPAYTVRMTLNLHGEDFDEVASRRDVYGEGAEGDAYKLHEANLPAIFDAMLDYSRLPSIGVPD
jgi:hypothetical protein